MTFAHPLALLFALLAVPVVLLYRLRLRRHREVVATSVFWEQVMAEDLPRMAWAPIRETVSLAVQLTFLALVVLALAEPQIPPPRHIVLIIDNAPGMNATDVTPSRLEAAKQAAVRLIAALRPCDEVAVISSEGTVASAIGAPAVHCVFTAERRTLAAAIEGVPQGAGPGRMPAAIQAARDIPLPPGSARRIVIFSDGCFDQASQLVADSGCDLVRVGTPAANTAITRWTVRRTITDPRVCQVLVEVRNFADSPAAGCRLSIALGDKPVTEIPIDSLPAEGQWRQVFQMTCPQGGKLTARLDPPDVYPADNEAAVELPSISMHRVILVSKDNAHLRRALEASPLVQLTVAQTPPKNVPKGQILVLDGQTPATLPEGPVLVFNPGPCDQWQLGAPLADPVVTALDETSSLMSGVRMVDVYLPEARALVLSDDAKDSATPLAWAGRTPVGFALDRSEGRALVLCGNLAASNMVLQSALPILTANALNWLADESGRAGEIRGVQEVNPPGRAGLDLRAPAGLGSDLSSARPWPWPSAWILPALVALAGLFVEWRLYQRRWIS